ncbi:MAG: tetratricopeptide repeat protein [Lachnospiraceae bacterium]|nr:tetratricopeptide repeat protein [Lachnospiraceae bacterium]
MRSRRALQRGLTVAVTAGIILAVTAGCSLPFGQKEEDARSVAIAALENREYREALDQLQSIQAQGEDDAELWRAIGIAQMNLGDYEDAENSLETALRKSGGVPGKLAYDLSYYLAETLQNKGDEKGAIDVYDAMLALRPSEKDVYYLRGLCYLACGDHGAAKEDFQVVLEEKPRSYDRILCIYEALAKAGYSPEGSQMLEQILTEDGASMTNYEKGRFCYYLGQLEDARGYLEEANNETGVRAANRIPIVMLLGEVSQMLGDDAYAISVYRRFLQDDQSAAGVYNALGVLEMRMGSYSDALSDFQIGLSLNDPSQNAPITRNIAAVYEYMGNFELAASQMEAYLALVPTDEAAKRENIFLSTRIAEISETETEDAEGVKEEEEE